MSSTTNLQNVLANVVRPVYVYDPATSNYVAKIVVSNVDSFSVRTLEVENLEFGDARSNVYLGVDAGSANPDSARNVGIGVAAAQNNIRTKDSVFVGYAAGGNDITDVSATVAIGSSTLAGGYSNVYIGYGTGSSSSNATGNIFIGPALTTASESNQLRIGVASNIPLSANMSTGSVGIYTTAPQYPLDVSGSSSITGQFRNTSTRASVRVTGGGTADSNGLSLYHDAAGQGLYTSNSLPLGFSTNGTRQMTILSSGNVGVGIQDPSFALDVNGTVRASTFIGLTGSATFGGVLLSNGAVEVQDGSSTFPTVGFQNDMSLGLYRVGSNMLGFASAGSNRMTLSNGNLGIATTAPAYTLDVSGTTSSSNLLVPGYLRDALTPSQFDISSGTLRMSNRILTGAGTVSAPAYTFTNDASMGLYDPATNVLGFVTAGLERMRVASNGSVGIGKTNPAYPLDVSGTINATTFLGSASSYGSFGAVLLINGAVSVLDGSVSAPTVTFQNDASLGLYRTASNVLAFASGGSNRMTLSNANLGIGTTAPARVLDVSGTVQIQQKATSLLVTDTSAGFVELYTAFNDYGIIRANGSLDIFQAGTARGALPAAPKNRLSSDSGNSWVTGSSFGVGMSNPSYPLDVSGTAQTSNLLVPGYLRNALTPSQFDISGGNIMQTGSLVMNSTDTTKIYFVTSPSIGLNGPRVSHGSGWTLSFFTGWTSNNNEGNYSFNRASSTTATGTLEMMRITNAGGVGIGTSAPTGVLDVSGTATYTGMFRNSAGQASIMVVGNGWTDTSGIQLYHNSSEQGLYANTNNLRLHIWTNNARRLTITPGGNVGIGTQDPSDNLHVAGALRLSTNPTPTANGTTALFWNQSGVGPTIGGQNFQVRTNAGGLAALHVAQTGNVGIGTTAPAGVLDVSSQFLVFTNSGLPASVSQYLAIAGSSGSPTSGRILFGDGSGWKMHFSRRSGSATTDLVTITDGGNVGIGTTNPTYALDISVALAGGVNISGSNANLNLADPRAAAQPFQIYIDGTAAQGFQTANSLPIRFANASTTRMTIGGTGLVGIGTTAPAYRLDVSTAPTTASINMSTWPRMNTASNFFWVRGHCNALSASYRLRWNTTNTNSPNTNILDWQDNATHGTYFRILKSGIWSISYWYSAGTMPVTAWVDVSTSFSNGYASPSTAGAGELVAIGQMTSGGSVASVQFTGYLGSNTARYYRFSVNQLQSYVSNNLPYLTVALLYETPDITPTFP